MILARCPACGTTFRVRPEQVQARAGRVRCGHCQHAFNALESRLDDNPPGNELPPPIVPAIAETPLFVLEEKRPINEQDARLPDDAVDLAPHALDASVEGADESAPISQPAETPEPGFEPGFDTAPDTEPPAAAPTSLDDAEPANPNTPPGADEAPEADDAPGLPGYIESDDAPPIESEPAPADLELRVEPFADIDIEQAWPPADPDGDATAPAEPPAPAFQPDWPDAAELDLSAPQHEAVDFDALLHKQDADTTPPEALAANSDDQPWPASEEPAAMLAEPRAELAPRVEPMLADDEPIAQVVPANPGIVEPDGPAPDESDDDSEPTPPATQEPAPPAPALRQAAWAAGATLLVLALLGQGVLVFRSEIVQSSPQMRPFMESLCSGLGCELPLPRNAADIAIESSDIQPDANREAFFTLHATLRNRAEYAQAYPHLEITLTDARDKALVRKVLEPAQWLPADAPKDAFAAQREVSTRIGFEAPGVAAAGYRVYVFYP